MVIRIICGVVALALAGVAEATIVDTNVPSEVAAFQTNATVNNFENVPTRTPQSISDYTSGVAVSAAARVFAKV